jgi:ribosomal protein S18 acetylase RimI-like enzyme
MINNIPVIMTHENLLSTPEVAAFERPYQISNFQSGDELSWSVLQATTDSFATNAAALAFFQNEFGSDSTALTKKCYFLKTDDQQFIGTAMAWHADPRFDDGFGRLHWVVIHPDYRGKGLGRQLIRYTMQQLSQQYAKAYLTTQTISYPAINIYLDLGFRPWISNDQDKIAWRLLKELLKHPALD